MFIRSIIIPIIFFVFISSAFSQNFEGGIIVGFATSQFSGDDLGGFHKPGMIAGAFTATPIGKKSMMQFEIDFVQKGSWDPTGKHSKYKLNLNYVDAPLLFKYPYKKFILEAGPVLGTLINYTEKNLYGDVNDSRKFARFELAGIIGFDYALSDKLIINAKYNNSILPVRKHVDGATYRLNWGQYNTIIEVSVHYKIKMIKN